MLKIRRFKSFYIIRLFNMVCKDTLKIKNLPKELTDAQKEEFARHFGASKIKVITSHASGRSTVYAKFDSIEIAKSVLFRLHQISVLNNILCVEYAEKDILQGKLQTKKLQESDNKDQRVFKSFVTKINAFNDSVGFNQPPPAHLKYAYPKANRATVNNIAHALATIPKFYIQVLHLMNRMNLPPPFAIPNDPPPQKARHVAPLQPTQPPLPAKQQGSSEESEMESDEESLKQKEIIPQKRTLPQKKIVKRPKFIKPPIAQPQSTTKPPEKTENVFEKADIPITPKRIEVKVTSDALENKSETELTKAGSFGIMLPLVKPNIEESNSATENTEYVTDPIKKTVISDEELLANQIPLKDLGVLPVFKNYHPGVPTCRLYIKNCAKTVCLEDLACIYNRYKIKATEDAKPSQFDIRLMQEGRMKGQAFVTLESVELAQKALKETNGYILKDKPLVVVFARSATPKK